MPSRTLPQDPEMSTMSVKLRQSLAAGGGEMIAIRHAAVLSRTPVGEGEAPVVLNAHKAVWLPRV
jgi:hypothetical protein